MKWLSKASPAGRYALDVVGHLGGGDEPDLDECGPDRRAPQVGTQARSEVVEARLRRRVHGHTGERPDAGQRRQVDDVTATAPQHPGDGLAAQLDRHDEVEPVEELDVGRGHGGEPAGHVHPGVVDEHVDGAAVCLDAVDEAGDLLLVGEVCWVGGTAESPGQLLERALGAGHEGDACAGGGETLGEGLADAAGGPRDQDPLARKLHRAKGIRASSDGSG